MSTACALLFVKQLLVVFVVPCILLAAILCFAHFLSWRF